MKERKLEENLPQPLSLQPSTFNLQPASRVPYPSYPPQHLRHFGKVIPWSGESWIEVLEGAAMCDEQEKPENPSKKANILTSSTSYTKSWRRTSGCSASWWVKRLPMTDNPSVFLPCTFSLPQTSCFILYLTEEVAFPFPSSCFALLCCLASCLSSCKDIQKHTSA